MTRGLHSFLSSNKARALPSVSLILHGRNNNIDFDFRRVGQKIPLPFLVCFYVKNESSEQKDGSVVA